MRQVIRVSAAVVAGLGLVLLASLDLTGGTQEAARDVSAAAAHAYRQVVPPPRERQTRAMNRADVEAEVESAVSRRDYRLVGIGGIGLFFPGLNDRDGRVERIAKKYGYRYIDGTSDYADSPEQERFQMAAYEYARRYNLNLWPQIPK